MPNYVLEPNSITGNRTLTVPNQNGTILVVSGTASGSALYWDGTGAVGGTSGGSTVPTRYYATSLPYTLGTNSETILIVSSSVTGTITLPSVATWAVSKGQAIIKNISANSCSVNASGSDTIDASGSYTLNQNSALTLEWYLSGSTYNWIIV